MIYKLLLIGSIVSVFVLHVIHPAYADVKCTDCWVSEALVDKTGVYCQINNISLFAKSFKDCTDAGGLVTHSETPEVKLKLGENITIQNQTPETPDNGDKKPNAK